MIEADSRLPQFFFSTLSLTAFKPRQVVLAEQQEPKSKPGLRMVKNPDGHLDHKAALNHSILNYLQKNGFSKTLKRFLKEAQIEDENWKTSLDLEDVYSRYLENSRDVDKAKALLEPDIRLEKGSDDFSEDAIGKKKKKYKTCLENGEGDGKGRSEVTAKSKGEKEKQKLTKVSSVEEGQETKKKNNASDTQAEDCKTESKKKKKKKEVVSTKSSENGQDMVDQVESLKASENGAKEELKKRKISVFNEKEETTKSSDNGQKMVDQGEPLDFSENGAKKKSKKRKLPASDESENKPVEKSGTGESKRRKTEDPEKAKVGLQQGKVKSEDNSHADQKEPQKLSNKEVNGSTEEDLMKNRIENSADQQLARKQQNGSAQPKTAANAFQRVKVDEVKYADERLLDNSYWAKDGAEYGYGAKAQEVLGQVKGRGFRHEKTKKKRGSYRGGQIDFQSHSIKFNYDDEE